MQPIRALRQQICTSRNEFFSESESNLSGRCLSCRLHLRRIQPATDIRRISDAIMSQYRHGACHKNNTQVPKNLGISFRMRLTYWGRIRRWSVQIDPSWSASCAWKDDPRPRWICRHVSGEPRLRDTEARMSGPRRLGDAPVGSRYTVGARDIRQQRPDAVRLHRYVRVVQQPVEFIKLTAIFRSGHAHLSSHGQPGHSAMRPWQNRGFAVNMSWRLAFRIARAITVTTGWPVPVRDIQRLGGLGCGSATRHPPRHPVPRHRTSRSVRQS